MTTFLLTWLTKAKSVPWYYFAMVGCLFFGGCAGCSCERHRPHWIVKSPAEVP